MQKIKEPFALQYATFNYERYVLHIHTTTMKFTTASDVH